MAKLELPAHLSLMADVANCPPLNDYNTDAKYVTDLIIKHSLCLDTFVARDLDAPETPVMIVPTDGKKKIFVLSDATKQALELAAKRADVDISYLLLELSAMNTKNFQIIGSFLKSHSKIVNLFLAFCRENQELPEAVLNKVFRRYTTIYPISFKISNFKPQISYQTFPQSFQDFNSELEQRMFLIPLLKGDGQFWVRNRLCEECGKVFFYKSQKAKFCSDACKMRNVRNKRA